MLDPHQFLSRLSVGITQAIGIQIRRLQLAVRDVDRWQSLHLLYVCEG